MISPPPVDGRRVESFFQELKRFAPYYTPDLNISDPQSAGVALMRIFAQLAEIVAVRLDQAPQKHFVAFLDKLGITLLPARPATAAVTFRLASGFEEAVKVPVGTRVTAAGVDDEIPFETTKELLAIPGVLAAAYGVDPLKDLILRPPLGFLKQEARTPSELSYEIQSFVPKDSNRLQLNHTTELEAGSFIRIACKEKQVVQKVDEGNFVTLYTPVKEDYREGTIIVPIRNFEVFNGIDRQEHILYIAHNNLFTIKEEVEITLAIELKDAQTTLEPLELNWQFWTKDEDKVPEEEEHWEPLEVRLDGTAGLSSSGRVVLVKKKDLEIKPRKVGGRESRWIRAELKEKLPVGRRELPEIETIQVGVNTKLDPDTGKPTGILADQGFYNATPLDVKVDPGIGFFPFGTEPRQFDQFYIASEEAFSKRGAEVNLNFTLDLQTLAGPSLVRTSSGLRAYSIGLQRRLFELDMTGGSFTILGSPFDTATAERPQGSRYFPVEDSIPAALSTADGSIYKFVLTEDALDQDPNNRDHKIWVHLSRPGVSPFWSDLSAPGQPKEKKRVARNPVAIALPSGWPLAAVARVFAIGSDQKLYFRDISNSAIGLGTWQPHTSTEPTCISSPFVTVLGTSIHIYVTATPAGDTNGVVHRLIVNNGTAGTWESLNPSVSFNALSRPFAQTIGTGPNAKVFVVGTDKGADQRKLFELDMSAAGPWVDLGRPPAGIPSTGPEVVLNGYLENASDTLDREGKHIFLRGEDNQLWEREDGKISLAQDRWENRTRPGDPPLRDSPVVYADSSVSPISVTVLSASDHNSLVRWQFEIHRGPSVSPDLLAVLLNTTTASTKDSDYNGKTFDVVPTSGPGQSSSVAAYDGDKQLVRLQSALTSLPNPTDKLIIDKAGLNIDVGPLRPETNHLLALHNPQSTDKEAFVRSLRLDNTFLNLDRVEFYNALTGVVSINPPFAGSFANFVLYVELKLPNEFLANTDMSTVPELSWEYWNGRGWLSLPVTDGTRNLLSSGTVIIPRLPKDIESTEVAGQENYWIRARLVGGDYGRETFKIDGAVGNQQIVSVKSSLRPPKVQQLLISYKAKPVAPEICLTFNNLDYLDQTAATENKDSHFPPFETLEDKSFTIFFGFDKTFKTGPVRLLIDAAERNYDESKPPEFAWSFRKDRKWKELDAEDGSGGLMRQGILSLNAPEELTRETRFGESLYWIKGFLRLDRALAEVGIESDESAEPCGKKEVPPDPCGGAKDETKTGCTDENHAIHTCGCSGAKRPADPCEVKDQDKASTATAAASAQYPLPLLLGVFLNTVWAVHGETITDEIVGSGDGEQNQTHATQHGDVLEGEDIRIQEALSTEERERIERELGKQSVTDREDIGGTWVRWKAVKALFDCGPQDRCYEIDRAAGILKFGDGVHGSIAPAGVDNIRAFSYRTGGGVVGNVKTNDIQALATAVAGIESVFNPVPAGGGSDKADTEDMLTIGPHRLSHHDRAVSVEDFEELASEASRQIAKVRCLGATNLVRGNEDLSDPCDPRQLHEPLEQRGWVSLIIVPDSPEPRPCPSLQLRRSVKEYLRQRAPSLVAAGERIVVRPPDYVTVSVQAKVFVSTLEKAAAVESEARRKLEEFLHPVRGGPEGTGWEFGRPVTRSDVFAVLEGISDVDRVEELVFKFGDKKNPDRVEIGRNQLLASGEHKLTIKKA